MRVSSYSKASAAEERDTAGLIQERGARYQVRTCGGQSTSGPRWVMYVAWCDYCVRNAASNAWPIAGSYLLQRRHAGTVTYYAVSMLLQEASHTYIRHQSRPFKSKPRTTQDRRRRTEIIPVKDSHTSINNITHFRIKPLALALASGHGRCML
jgi:hypothetical protein